MVGRSVSLSTVVRALMTLAGTAIYLNYGFSPLMSTAATAGAVAIFLAAVLMVEPAG